jgi:hypothetical protein
LGNPNRSGLSYRLPPIAKPIQNPKSLGFHPFDVDAFWVADAEFQEGGVLEQFELIG